MEVQRCTALKANNGCSSRNVLSACRPIIGGLPFNLKCRSARSRLSATKLRQGGTNAPEVPHTDGLRTHHAVRTETGFQEPLRISAEEAADFNRVTTRAMRVFLKQDTRSATAVQDEVIEVAAKYASIGNDQATTFLLALYSLLQHRLPRGVLPEEYMRAGLNLHAGLPDLRAGDESSPSGPESDCSNEEAAPGVQAPGGRPPLQGPYLQAFHKVFALLEDSGWKVEIEGLRLPESAGADDDVDAFVPTTSPNPYAQ